jgi:hypothetical protein
MLVLFLWMIAVLVAAVALIVMCGKSKNSIYSNIVFALTHIGAACWIGSLALFIFTSSVESAGIYLKIAYISALIMPLGFWLYALSIIDNKKKLLRASVSLIGVAAVAVLSALIIQDGSLVYQNISISNGGNTFLVNNGPFIMTYLGVFFVAFAVYNTLIIAKSKKSERAKKIEESKGYRNIFVGIMIGSLPTICFNGVLPILGSTELIWVGPASVAVAMIVVYFTSLRYEMFVTANKILQYLAYAVLVLAVALVYSVLFYILFLLLFRGAEPALTVIILNFLMVLILVLLLPVINVSRNHIKDLIKQKGIK